MVLAILAMPAGAQDYFTVTRRDEVGPRTLDFDEETFLNLLSFEQPLESLQPWLQSSTGFRSTFGSLDAETFYQEDDFKFWAPVHDRFGIRVYGRQAIDFDSSYFLLQVVPEFKISEHWNFLLPLNIEADKGDDDAGVGLQYTDPDHGIEYLQLSFLRADPFFNQRSDEFPDSEVVKPSNNLELQFLVDWGGAGKTSGKIARQFETEVDLVERGRTESFQRTSGSLVHSQRLTDAKSLYFRLDRDAAQEDIESLDPNVDPRIFDSRRNYWRARGELQHQCAGEDSGRLRFGLQQLYYSEHASSADPGGRVLRREYYAYGAYRTAPLSWLANADVETAIFLGAVDAKNDTPLDPDNDGRADPFQAKLNLYFRWAGERAELTITPSVGLDELRWGGGGANLRLRF